MIVARFNMNLDKVVPPGVAVFPPLGRMELFDLVVKRFNSDVEAGKAVGDADLGLLGCKLLGPFIYKIRRNFGVLPKGFIKNSIDRKRRIYF